MDLGLAGRTVVITGGSGGIGHGLVLEFAREGCKVVNASRDVVTGEKLAAEAVAQGLAGEVLPVATDVTRRTSVDAMLATAKRRFGSVDVLVNNAGGVDHPAAFANLDEAARRWEIALNIDGVVNCCQAVAGDMLARGSGSIINISSNSSLLGEAAAAGRAINLKAQSVRSRDGHTGARPSGAIGFATLRGGSVVGEHTVMFAGPAERIELTHKAESRDIFARGAVRAALWAFDKKPGLYSMSDVLGVE